MDDIDKATVINEENDVKELDAEEMDKDALYKKAYQDYLAKIKEYEETIEKFNEKKVYYDKTIREFQEKSKLLEESKKEFEDKTRKLELAREHFKLLSKQLEEKKEDIEKRDARLKRAESLIENERNNLEELRNKLEKTRVDLEKKLKEFEDQVRNKARKQKIINEDLITNIQKEALEMIQDKAVQFSQKEQSKGRAFVLEQLLDKLLTEGKFSSCYLIDEKGMIISEKVDDTLDSVAVGAMFSLISTSVLRTIKSLNLDSFN
ncbi:MAG: hypothetical protein ACTSVE_07350, partial [Candidatus Helarchaeota archaeon]